MNESWLKYCMILSLVHLCNKINVNVYAIQKPIYPKLYSTPPHQQRRKYTYTLLYSQLLLNVIEIIVYIERCHANNCVHREIE